nr:MAG TPA: hypothetical protein [Caudoviricetes sp.]
MREVVAPGLYCRRHVPVADTVTVCIQYSTTAEHYRADATLTVL